MEVTVISGWKEDTCRMDFKFNTYVIIIRIQLHNDYLVILTIPKLDFQLDLVHFLL